MLHYSCDLCQRPIREERYVAKLELTPAFDPEELAPADLDTDHLEVIADSIAAMESTGEFELEDLRPKQFRFDLCPACFRRVMSDPLGGQVRRPFNFSKN